MLRRAGAMAAGLLLVAAGGWGTVFAARATWAYTAYQRAKYLMPPGQADAALRLADRTHAAFPWNYFLCMLAAETAYDKWQTAASGHGGDFRRSAAFWTEEGLRLNPYKRPLRYIQAHLLAEHAPLEAALAWERYVDWHFWDPYNHAVLVHLHALAGRYHDALRSLELIRGTREERMARRALRAAWQRERSAPPPAPLP